MGTKWRRSPFNGSTLFADSRDGMNFLHFLLLAADFRAQKRLIAVAFFKEVFANRCLLFAAKCTFFMPLSSIRRCRRNTEIDNY